MISLPISAFGPVFEDLRGATQKAYLRAQAEREAVDLMLDLCNRLDGLGIHLTATRVPGEAGAVTLALEILLTPPNVAGRMADLRSAQGAPQGKIDWDVIYGQRAASPSFRPSFWPYADTADQAADLADQNQAEAAFDADIADDVVVLVIPEFVPPEDAQGPVEAVSAVPDWLRPQSELLSEHEIPAGQPADMVQDAANPVSPPAAQPADEPVSGAGPEASDALPCADAPAPEVAGSGDHQVKLDEAAQYAPWTPREIDILMVQRKAGVEFDDICKLLPGRTKKASEVKFHKHRPQWEAAQNLKANLTPPLLAPVAVIEVAPPPMAVVAPVAAPPAPEGAIAATTLPASDQTLLASGRLPMSQDLSIAAREMRARMNALGYAAPFTPYIDYTLVSDLAKGVKLDMISADLGIDTQLLKRRWMTMIAGIEAPRGGLSPNDQGNLLVELRARMMGAAK